jgi:hypothetical protein
MFGSGSNRALELLMGGWQLNYIELIQSGQQCFGALPFVPSVTPGHRLRTSRSASGSTLPIATTPNSALKPSMLRTRRSRNAANVNPTNNRFRSIAVSQSDIPRQVQLSFKLNFQAFLIYNVR